MGKEHITDIRKLHTSCYVDCFSCRTS